jgi:4-hydroxybenzoate polyprenyltransferase
LTNSNTPIAVDLDGTLIYTDMLYETFVRALFRSPWIIFLLLPWLLKGRAYLKYQLTEHSEIDVEVLPYNVELIEYLSAKKDTKIVLCTATNQELAEKISAHLGIFSETMGSSLQCNLAGTTKAKALVEKFGEKEFIYAGNEIRDLKIWEKAKGALVVGSTQLATKATEVCAVEKTFNSPRLSIKTVLKAIRLHQWVKNALIFIPLITSHKFTELPLFLACVIAFIAFGLCASATYLINDLSDLDSDRKHSKKRLRPLARGTLSIHSGFVIIVLLLTAAVICALMVNLLFFLVLCGYTAITLGYSFWFKRLQTVDIVVLASLYTIRIIAGGAAISVVPTFWLLTFSMFVFLCLAIIKRISELIKKNQDHIQSAVGGDAAKISGRGYYTSDIDILRSLATSSGLVSILVFAMYIDSSDVALLYNFPQALWLVCPVFAYWVMRILIMTSRGEVDEDPITFALKDTRSWFAGAAIVAAIALAL